MVNGVQQEVCALFSYQLVTLLLYPVVQVSFSQGAHSAQPPTMAYCGKPFKHMNLSLRDSSRYNAILGLNKQHRGKGQCPRYEPQNDNGISNYSEHLKQNSIIISSSYVF